MDAAGEEPRSDTVEMSAVSNPGTHFVSGLGNEDVTAKLRSLGNGGIHEVLWGRGDWPADLDDAHGREGRLRRSVDEDLRRSGPRLGSKALLPAAERAESHIHSGGVHYAASV